MSKSNISKLMFLLIIFLFWGNLNAQDTGTSPKVKVVLSEKLAQRGITLYDYSVRTNPTQYGFLTTSICFTSNSPLPKIVLNVFDKEDRILYQAEEIYQSNRKAEFKNMAYVYHCYIDNFDSNFIKTIVIEQQ